MLGTAQEARMWSTVMAWRLEENFSSAPVTTLAAPMTSVGRVGRGPQAAISAKSICVSSSALKSEKPLRCPDIMNCVAICTAGDDGLKCNVGHRPELMRRDDCTMKRLIAFSVVPCAVFSSQNFIRRPHKGRSFLRCAYQTRAAQTAPPEVPLMPTTSKL
jgi:hypothetical protein